jgi:hypothetical protein
MFLNLPDLALELDSIGDEVVISFQDDCFEKLGGLKSEIIISSLSLLDRR